LETKAGIEVFTVKNREPIIDAIDGKAEKVRFETGSGYQ